MHTTINDLHRDGNAVYAGGTLIMKSSRVPVPGTMIANAIRLGSRDGVEGFLYTRYVKDMPGKQAPRIPAYVAEHQAPRFKHALFRAEETEPVVSQLSNFATEQIIVALVRGAALVSTFADADLAHQWRVDYGMQRLRPHDAVLMYDPLLIARYGDGELMTRVEHMLWNLATRKQYPALQNLDEGSYDAALFRGIANIYLWKYAMAKGRDSFVTQDMQWYVRSAERFVATALKRGTEYSNIFTTYTGLLLALSHGSRLMGDNRAAARLKQMLQRRFEPVLTDMPDVNQKADKLATQVMPLITEDGTQLKEEPQLEEVSMLADQAIFS